MLLDVMVMNPQGVLFEGKAKSVIVPGEAGTFEIIPFHKPILSRLVSGMVHVDENGFSINRGIIKVASNTVTIIAEDAP